MKYLKKFENKTNNFKIGQYVVAENLPYTYIQDLKNFLNNNVGQITMIGDKDYIDNSYSKYYVKYENIPKNLEYLFYKNQKESYTKNIRLATEEEIENYKLNKITNKFNI